MLMNSFGKSSMNLNNKRNPMFSVGRLLNLPATLISRIGWRLCKLDRCMIEGDHVVLYKGLFTTRKIHPSEIGRWSVDPEMGFDVVRIELANGEALTWFDKYHDLLGALEKLAQPKEASPDRQ
jgi:hypothetical protein